MNVSPSIFSSVTWLSISSSPQYISVPSHATYMYFGYAGISYYEDDPGCSAGFTCVCGDLISNVGQFLKIYRANVSGYRGNTIGVWGNSQATNGNRGAMIAFM